jgi:hypothetical protein
MFRVAKLLSPRGLGNYLKKEDLDGPITVTVDNVWAETVFAAARKKFVIAFGEPEKPLILNKTNIRQLVRMFDRTDTAAWKNRRITLYVESTVAYEGES